jgi:hypothetical protein
LPLPRGLAAAGLVVALASPARAQDHQHPAPAGEHAAHQTEAGPWTVALHGSLFVQYIQEWAPIHRGARQFGSINWIMATAHRRAGAARAGMRAMFSLEPWTIPGCGYPDLLATGELCEGDGLHDRQHPHDLFMEVAGEYERPLSAGSPLSWRLYGGPAGEPALGPTAFPHRASAASNPIAPISHHWLDATHTSFGVVTAGLSGGRWRVEASAFSGREPDEQRTGFDLAALDSFSGRVTIRPHPSLAMQVSAGRIESAEEDFANGPRYDITRVTASAQYERGRLAGMVAWGTNAERGQHTHAGLAEANVTVGDGVAFGRVELNSKPSHSLHIHEQPDAILTVGKLQGGYVHYARAVRGVQMGLGGSVSTALVPPSIRPNYGGVGFGIAVFAHVRPAPH